MAEITALPQEIVIHIFSFLDSYHQRVASLVCKKWLAASNDTSLLENNYVIFEEITTFPDEFFSASRNFTHFKFIRSEIDEKCLIFFKKFGQQIRFLHFEDCSLGATISASSRIHFENLNTLKFLNSELWSLFFPMPKLKRIEIFFPSNSYINDCNMRDIDQIVSLELSSLSFSCPICCDHKAYKRFYPHQETEENRAHCDILSFPAVESFIKKRSKTLTSLDLNGSKLNEDAALRLANIDNLRLQVLSLKALSQVCRSLASFCQRQSSITSLNIANLCGLKDETVNSICQALPNLQEINISFNDHINGSLQSIFQLKKLAKTDLTLCAGITSSSFHSAIAAFKPMYLTSLALKCTSIRCLTLKILLVQVRYLRYLDLSFCCVTDVVLFTISKNLSLLKSLFLKSCSEITDRGLTGRLDIDNTQTLELENNNCDIPTPLSNIKGLLILDLSGNNKITKVGFMEAVHFQNLQQLMVENCFHLQFLIQEEIKAQNPCLRIFKNLNNNDNFF